MTEKKTFGELSPEEANQEMAEYGRRHISDKEFRHLVNLAAENIGK